jgi:hypothetical protein
MVDTRSRLTEKETITWIKLRVLKPSAGGEVF